MRLPWILHLPAIACGNSFEMTINSVIVYKSSMNWKKYTLNNKHDVWYDCFKLGLKILHITISMTRDR